MSLTGLSVGMTLFWRRTKRWASGPFPVRNPTSDRRSDSGSKYFTARHSADSSATPALYRTAPLAYQKYNPGRMWSFVIRKLNVIYYVYVCLREYICLFFFFRKRKGDISLFFHAFESELISNDLWWQAVAVTDFFYCKMMLVLKEQGTFLVFLCSQALVCLWKSHQQCFPEVTI